MAPWSKRVQTTSYHPQANGMVECFHCQLQVALKTHSNSWIDTLPFVMLGIRTALKDDIHLSTAELVYGTTLRIPGTFLTCSDNPLLTQQPVFPNSRHSLNNSAHRPPACQSHPHTLTSISLIAHVFIRHDAVRKPLQPPYDGPYPVIKCKEKYFGIDING